MKLKSLTIQGFRSFEQEQHIDFDAMRPGLYLVTGENQVEPELGANAIGKSSLFDALDWIQFDRTSRGLRAGAVKSWHSEEQCAGVLELEAAAGHMGIMRAWNPNVLEAGVAGEAPRPMDQEELERLLGYSHEMFLFTSHFAQSFPGQPSAFVDLKPVEQTELFSRVLRLSLWESASDCSSEVVKEMERVQSGLAQHVARIEGQAQELLDRDYVKEEAAWDKEQEKKLASARSECSEIEDAVQDQSLRVVELKGSSDKFKAKRVEEEEQASACANLASLKRSVEEELRRLRAKDLTKCPSCGQALAKDSLKHIHAEIKSKQSELAEISEELDKESEKHDKLLKQLAGLRDGEVKYGEVQRALSSAEAKLSSAKQWLERCQQEENPFSKLRREAESRGEELVSQIEVANAELDKSRRESAAAQFWVKGFKEIRLALIRESLAQLTVESNEVLYQLGLRNWSLEFDVERETKAKGISKGFDISVHAPQSRSAIPWAAWSGGESQRLRLSASMGLANLISARTGLSPNVEFWDEPTEHMTNGGIFALLEVLVARAQRYKRAIFLADHRSLDFGGFEGVVKIVKDKTGSHVHVA